MYARLHDCRHYFLSVVHLHFSVLPSALPENLRTTLHLLVDDQCSAKSWVGRGTSALHGVEWLVAIRMRCVCDAIAIAIVDMRQEEFVYLGRDCDCDSGIRLRDRGFRGWLVRGLSMDCTSHVGALRVRRSWS